MREPVKYNQGKRTRFVYPDKEWLEYQYHILGKSSQNIADEIGTDRGTIIRWMKRENVPLRTKEQRDRRHSKRMSDNGNPAWCGGESRNYLRKVMLKKQPSCVWCGHTKNLQIHHIDHNTDNNEDDNLTVLCGPCNRMEAQLWILANSGRALVSWKDKDLIISFG